MGWLLLVRIVSWLVALCFGDLVGVLALVEGGGAVVVVVGVAGRRRRGLGGATLAGANAGTGAVVVRVGRAVCAGVLLILGGATGGLVVFRAARVHRTRVAGSVLVLFSAGGRVVIFGSGGVDGALSPLRVLAGVTAVGAWHALGSSS